MTLAAIAGPSALVAAVATVLGAVFLILFFRKGGQWGLLNDVASIVLMLATIPVALLLGGADDAGWRGLNAPVVTAIGVIGMLGASVSQALLVARVRTYKQLLPWTLGAGAVVGVWYLLVGFLGLQAGFPLILNLLAIASGAGFIAIGYGFWRGSEQHPLSIAGGVVLLIASTGILAWVGLAAIAAYGLSR